MYPPGAPQGSDRAGLSDAPPDRSLPCPIFPAHIYPAWLTHKWSAGPAPQTPQTEADGYPARKADGNRTPPASLYARGRHDTCRRSAEWSRATHPPPADRRQADSQTGSAALHPARAPRDNGNSFRSPSSNPAHSSSPGQTGCAA